MYTHTHTHTHTHTYTHTYTHPYTHTPSHTYTHAHTYTHTYIHTYTHTPSHTHTHIHLHTHTVSPSPILGKRKILYCHDFHCRHYYKRGKYIILFIYSLCISLGRIQSLTLTRSHPLPLTHSPTYTPPSLLHTPGTCAFNIHSLFLIIN